MMKHLVIAAVLLATPAAAQTPADVPAGAISAYNEGIRKYRAGDLDGSIAAFDRAIEIFPDYWKALSSRGVAKHDKKDGEGALRDYSRAIQINPKNAGTYSNRG